MVAVRVPAWGAENLAVVRGVRHRDSSYPSARSARGVERTHLSGRRAISCVAAEALVVLGDLREIVKIVDITPADCALAPSRTCPRGHGSGASEATVARWNRATGSLSRGSPPLPFCVEQIARGGAPASAPRSSGIVARGLPRDSHAVRTGDRARA